MSREAERMNPVRARKRGIIHIVFHNYRDLREGSSFLIIQVTLILVPKIRGMFRQGIQSILVEKC